MLIRTSLLILIVFVFLGFTNEHRVKSVLVYPPVATMQLGPSIFLSDIDFAELNIEEGTPERIVINNKIKDLRVYRSLKGNNKVGLHKQYLSFFKLKYGDTIEVVIKKINKSETKLSAKPIKFSVKNYKGNLDKWQGYAIGAPHGDCDNETGAVVKIVSEKFGIPSTAAYGCRISYRGIWYDCNRPLMKEPKENGHGVIPERQWNELAETKYNTFQDSIWANSKYKYGKRFKLFTSFHGHDLTVKLPNGNRIQRPVIEGMGVGFTKDELRKIKAFYYRNRDGYYKEPPDLYFGNLPEDLVYKVQGVPLNFFYSGLGSRTYGSLRSDLCEHVLHFETPNSMRIDPDVQPVTAQLLKDIYSFVRDSIFTDTKKTRTKNYKYEAPINIEKKVKLKGGEFLFGAPKGFGWASEGPQNRVVLSPFEIDIYEVTNNRFCSFMNEAYKKNEIIVKNGNVLCKNDSSKILFVVKSKNPFSEIEFIDNHFNVISGRENFPVVFVTYYGANEYAMSKGERLPTEAEWEYAASWNGNKKFFYGIGSDKFSGSQANFEDSGDPYENHGVIETTPVGFYNSQSPNGCKDMSGNVWEWCSDYYLSNIHNSLKYKGVINPKNTKYSTMKVIKGGAWNTEGLATSTTKRLGINPNTSLINLGFRCAKGIKK